MRTSPLLADFIHARGCKPICAKLLTLPISVEPEMIISAELQHFYSSDNGKKEW